MGEELADGRSDYLAGPRDWRTPPLWGLGLSRTVSGQLALLHDGRARTVTEAILWHGGAAEPSKRAFVALPREEQSSGDFLQTPIARVAGIDAPDGMTGLSLVGEDRRETLYCEALEGQAAMRMVTDGRWKLIWYPAGNHVQLFDCETDPDETKDLSSAPDAAPHLERLSQHLASELYGGDLAFLDGARLVGTPADPVVPQPNRGLSGQRGLHFPEPPPDDPSKVVGAP